MKKKSARRHRRVRRSSSSTVWYLTIAFIVLLAVLFGKNIYAELHKTGVLGQSSSLLADERIPGGAPADGSGSGSGSGGDSGGSQPQQQSQPQTPQSSPQQQSQPQQQTQQSSPQTQQMQQQSGQQQYQPKNADEQKQMQQYIQQSPEQQKQTYQQYQQQGEQQRSQQYQNSQTNQYQIQQGTTGNSQSGGNNTPTNQTGQPQYQMTQQQMRQAEQQFRQEAAKNGIQFSGSLPPEALRIQQQMMQQHQQTQQRQNEGNANSGNASQLQPINFSQFQALPSSKDFPTISGSFNVQTAGSQSRINLNNANTSIQLGGQNLGLKARNEDGTEVEIDKDSLEKINTAIQLETGAQIQQNEDSVTLKRGLIEAQSKFPISFNVANKTFSVQTPNGTKEIGVLPDQAVEKLLQNKIITKLAGESQNGQTSTGVQLTELNNEPVFEVKGSSDQKMFGFFPVSVSKTSIVSAQSGNVVTTNQNIFSRLVDAISF